MIWKGDGKCITEEGEPAMRSCWECNGAHERLKKVNFLHVCYECGRYWVFDRYLQFETDADTDAYFSGLGLKPGESTSSIDGGYRVMQITVEASNAAE